MGRTIQVRADKFSDKGRETGAWVWLKLEEGASGDMYLTVRSPGGETALRVHLDGEAWRKVISPELDRTYEIRSEDVGVRNLKAFGTAWNLASHFGRAVQAGDVGKLVYRVTDRTGLDFLQIESEEQRAQRQQKNALLLDRGREMEYCGYKLKNRRSCGILRNYHSEPSHEFEPGMKGER